MFLDALRAILREEVASPRARRDRVRAGHAGCVCGLGRSRAAPGRPFGLVRHPDCALISLPWLACFGLRDDNHPHFPLDRLVENWPRLDVWMLLQCGALVEGAATVLVWGEKGCQLARQTPDIWIDGVRISIVWDQPMPGVCRPWFQCPTPTCARRCRHVYLRDRWACRRCHGLESASRHLRRQTPGVGRVERLRRKLGGCDERPFAPLPARRRGCSRAYHDKLVAMIHAEEAKLLGHLSSVVHDLDRRIRVRKAKGKW